MNERDKDSGYIILLLVIAACVMSSLVGWGTGSYVAGREQQKAIDAGVGRWRIDPKSGSSEFEYGVKQ